MLPVIALVGRPNVGKSTLFNQITRSRDALVANFPGLTRDRKYGEARIGDRPFVVIDTGGISGDEEGIDTKMAGQSLLAIEESDAVLFMVDARQGLNPADEALAKHLRQRNKTFCWWWDSHVAIYSRGSQAPSSSSRSSSATTWRASVPFQSPTSALKSTTVSRTAASQTSLSSLRRAQGLRRQIRTRGR